jgi:hypothetical protein
MPLEMEQPLKKVSFIKKGISEVMT